MSVVRAGRPLTKKSKRSRLSVEAVILSQLLRRGIRGDALADIVRRTRKTPTSTLAALAVEPNGVEKLFDIPQ